MSVRIEHHGFHYKYINKCIFEELSKNCISVELNQGVYLLIIRDSTIYRRCYVVIDCFGALVFSSIMCTDVELLAFNMSCKWQREFVEMKLLEEM